MSHFCALLSFLAFSAQAENGWLRSDTTLLLLAPDVPSLAASRAKFMESRAGKTTVQFQFPTRPGLGYQLQASPTIEAPVWLPVSRNFLATTHVTNAELDVFGERFYRLVEASFLDDDEGP